MQSQAETVATTELARKAADKLGLAERDEFNPASSGNPLALAFSLLAGGRGGASTTEDRVVDAFLARLTVFPVAKSRVLQIEFVSADPALAARGANTVAELYLAEQEDAKKNEAKAASAWLSQKIEELRAKVADADAKVEAFRANSGLLAGANGMTVPAQQLADINAQLAAARATQADAIAKAQSLRTMLREGRLDEIPDAAKDELLRRYVEQRVALKAQIALESRTLLPQHPRMKELNGELAGLDGEIRLAAGKAVLGLEDDAKLAGAEVDSLSAALAKQSKTVATGNVDDVQLRALELDAKTSRDQLESYLQKYREALAREADNAAPADARIIASASEPRTPTFPKKAPTVLLATLAGFLVSVGVVAAHALLTDAADASDGAASTPLAGASEREDEETAAPPSAAAESSEPDEVHDSFSSAEALADRLADVARDGEALTTLFAGEATSRALGLALTAARRLSKRGRAALVDLGVSQDWLSDILDREAESGREARRPRRTSRRTRDVRSRSCTAISPRASTSFRPAPARSTSRASAKRSRRSRRATNSSCCTLRTGDRPRSAPRSRPSRSSSWSRPPSASRARCGACAKTSRKRRSRRSASSRATARRSNARPRTSCDEILRRNRDSIRSEAAVVSLRDGTFVR